jgi:hypothetical protein
MKQNISQEAHTFYCLTIMSNIITNWSDYLIGSGLVHNNLKLSLKKLKNRVLEMQKECKKSLPANESEKWHTDLTERDIEVYSSVLFMLNDMTEDQRAAFEDAITKFKKETETYQKKVA